MRSLDSSAGRVTRILRALAQASHALAVSTDVVDSLGHVADICVREGFADYCSIHVSTESIDRDEISVTAGDPIELPSEDGTIVVPLSTGRNVLGSIRCETASPDGLGEEIRSAIGILAHLLAIVVNAHAAMMREHFVADRLQQALLPQELPVFPGITLHGAYRPASDETDVGGDWYDAFKLSDGRVAISVGDVAGHGLDAAVIMGEVRQAMRAAAVGSDSPAAVLENVNGVIGFRESIGMVTAVFGIYDPATSVLTYAVAGHPAPLLALSEGPVRQLPHGGMPLGTAPSIQSVDWTFTIPPGARAIFYTDGLVEYDRDILGGEERLLEVVSDVRGLPTDNPAEAIQERIFHTKPNRDDAATFVLSRTAPVPYYVFPAVPEASKLARTIVERELSLLRLCEDDRFGVLVAVGEAIANAVEHAYRGEHPGLIHLTLKPERGQLVLTIEDFGRWRPFVRSDERGRGIELMHAFMDGVQIRSTRDSTSIVLKLGLKREDAS